jgi:tellurite resistance protein TerC
VLFWGIIGAVVMRAIFILVGVSVLARFHWIIYIFGAFLVYTGIKMALPSKERWTSIPSTTLPSGSSAASSPSPRTTTTGTSSPFHNGKRMATPLFIVLIVIETTDVVFALDSLPAVLAITRDGFIALTSNIFAILGLRSLYFALNGIMQLFRYPQDRPRPHPQLHRREDADRALGATSPSPSPSASSPACSPPRC